MSARRSAAFTLIETIAVVVIFALLVAVVAPNLGNWTGRALRDSANTLAGRIELARERTLLTGVPHRVWIDLDAGSYRVEWLVSEAQAQGDPEPEAAAFDLDSRLPLPLEAPRGAEREFRPLPGSLGRDSVLDEELGFRVETATDSLEQGGASIEFSMDGTTEAAAVILHDESGRELAVEVLPLAEAVRVDDVEG